MEIAGEPFGGLRHERTFILRQPHSKEVEIAGEPFGGLRLLTISPPDNCQILVEIAGEPFGGLRLHRVPP